MAWKGQSRRHSLARKGIRTNANQGNFRSDGSGNSESRIDYLVAKIRMGHRFRDEYVLLKKRRLAYEDVDALFGDILEDAEKKQDTIPDEDYANLVESADRLYAELEKEDSEYWFPLGEL